MENKPTAFLLKKWKQAFRFIDRNKDGVITSNDLAEIADCISKRTGATEEQASNNRKEWVTWHSILALDKYKGENGYVEAVTKLYRNRKHHVELNEVFAGSLFDRMDLDKDGKISLEELSIFYGAVGLENLSVVEVAFKHIDKDGDGFIQREELVDDIVRHFTNPDPVEGQAYLISSVVENMR